MGVFECKELSGQIFSYIYPILNVNILHYFKHIHELAKETKRVENGLLCKNFILNDFSNNQYNYCNCDKQAKEIWQAQQEKYNRKKARAKKYKVSYYLKVSNDRINQSPNSHTNYRRQQRALSPTLGLKTKQRSKIGRRRLWSSPRSSKN